MIINGFNITKKGVITAYKGKSTDLVVPSEAVEIDRYAFRNAEFTSIVIPKSIKKLPDNLFFCQKKLKSVVLDADIEEIPKSCFWCCESLESVTLSDGISRIGEEAFYGCDKLTRVVFPNTLKSIGEKAFSGCVGLEEVVLPDGLETIGNKAFYRCDSLYIVAIPNSVKLNMSEDPFGYISSKSRRRYVIPCGSLFEDELLQEKKQLEKEARAVGLDITVDVQCATYMPGELDAVLSELRGNSDDIQEYKTTARLIIEDGVVVSSESQLADEIVIPEGVTEIKDSAFENNYLVKTVKSNSTCLKRIGKAAFKNCLNLQEASFANIITEIGCEAFSHCGSLERISFEKGTFSVGEEAFYDTCKLRSIFFPMGVTSIGERAFKHLIGRNKLFVYIPSSVFFIADRATDDVCYVLGEPNSIASAYCNEYEHRRGTFLEYSDDSLAFLENRLKLEKSVESRVFTVYGTEIETTNTFDLYQSVVKYYEDKREESILCIIKLLPNAIDGKFDLKQLDQLNELYTGIKKRLSRYAIPEQNATALESGLAYYTLNSQLYTIMSSCKTLQDSAYENLEELAVEMAYEAESKVTGLPYMIISSSALDLVAYSIDEFNARKRQREAAFAEAEKAFGSVIDQAQQLTASGFRAIAESMLPELEKTTSEFISKLIDDELAVLEREGLVQKEIIERFDIVQSNSIIVEAAKNEHIDKKKALSKALQLFPANGAAFHFAADNGLANEEVKALALFHGVKL